MFNLISNYYYLCEHHKPLICYMIVIKHARIVFLILTVIAADSCCADMLKKEFSTIETVLSEHPDSALKMLEAIDTSLLKNVSTRADYTLLKAKCLDKNFVDDGSLLSEMEEYEPYYMRRKSLEARMLFAYYLADQFYDSKEFEEASVRFVKALEYAEKNDDLFYCGQSCWVLSLIYLNTYNYSEELKYIKRAYDYLRKGGYDHHADYAEIQLAETFLKNRDKIKSLEYYDNVIDRAAEAKDSSLLGYALTSSALCLLTGSDICTSPVRRQDLLQFQRDCLKNYQGHRYCGN